MAVSFLVAPFHPAIMPAIPYQIERDFIPAVRVFDGALPAVVPAHNPKTELAEGPEALAAVSALSWPSGAM